jgi:EAL domain-containing protein (putative c-di-GMP-specific phosphodiesterase class I)
VELSFGQPAPTATGGPPQSEWTRAIQAVLDRSRPLVLHYQPIAELQGGAVVGYEALSRFPGPPPNAPPDAWFMAAANLGLGPELEAMVVRQAWPTVISSRRTPSSPSMSARTC